MSKRKALGKGFDALIPQDVVEEEFDPTADDKQGQSKRVDPDLIDPNPHQPRSEFKEEEMATLAESIAKFGLLQPLVITPSDNGRYQLIAGERRLRAVKKLGIEKVPAIVRSFDEQQKLELALIENLQREDLNPIETATAYKKLMDEFNLGYQEIARQVGKDKSTVVNSVRLLKLPKEIKLAVVEGEISEAHSRALLSLEEKQQQLETLQKIIKNGWTVKKTEDYVRNLKQAGSHQAVRQKTRIANQQTERLGQFLNTQVKIRPLSKGGRLVIDYQEDDDLERIVTQILGESAD